MAKKFYWVAWVCIAVVTVAVFGGFIARQQGWFTGMRRDARNTARGTNVQVSLFGTLVDIGVSSLSLDVSAVAKPDTASDKSKRVAISITESTRFEKTIFNEAGIPKRQSITRQAVKKHDIVSVDALLGEEGTLIASLVMVSPQANEKSGTPASGYTGGTVINGVVDSVKDGGFSIQTDSGETLSVLVDKDVNIMVAAQGQKPHEGITNDIKVGLKTSVMGVRQTPGEFAARQIMCVE
jgi:hypothetical protein